jgi:hypothetical protein
MDKVQAFVLEEMEPEILHNFYILYEAHCNLHHQHTSIKDFILWLEEESYIINEN